MRIFHSARRRPQWLRVALAAVLLGFALNSIAHVTHQHDAAVASAPDSLACGYCASFGGLADAPRHTYDLPAQAARVSPAALPVAVVRAFELFTSAHPRAPPRS